MKDTLEQLIKLQQRPLPFTPGEPLFWDDPHISSQMLQCHLDPNIEAASRRPEMIDRSVRWMIETLPLEAGDSVLDLGCGPGLYASHFAELGLQVTGVDYSRRSIDYASRYANDHHLNIAYRYENYLELNDENQYDAAFLIYGDFCPLNPGQRSRLLSNIHRALKPHGNSYWTLRLVSIAGSMATGMAGRRSKRDFGSQVCTWYWRRVLIIPISPSGSINILSSKPMARSLCTATGSRITHLKPSQRSWNRETSR